MKKLLLAIIFIGFICIKCFANENYVLDNRPIKWTNPPPVDLIMDVSPNAHHIILNKKAFTLTETADSWEFVRNNPTEVTK